MAAAIPSMAYYNSKAGGDGGFYVHLPTSVRFLGNREKSQPSTLHGMLFATNSKSSEVGEVFF